MGIGKNKKQTAHNAPPLKALAAFILCACFFALAAAPMLSPAAFAEGEEDTSGPRLLDGGKSKTEDEPPAEDDDENQSQKNPYIPDFDIAAEAVCLYNVDTGMFLYEKNADASLVPASLVKMMTCMIAMDWVYKYNIDINEALITSDKDWIYDALYGKNASTADIRKGETLTMRELFYAALLPSANEAALLLADWVSVGYMRNFLYLMNTRAKSLGCTGTWFDDANGLSELNCTTARDMVLITKAFMGYPELVEIAAEGSFQIDAHEKHNNPYYIHNTNRLMVASSPYYKAFPAVAGAVQAGKTGNLGEWQNFASFATKNGETYICVVLNSPYAADEVGAKIDPPQTRPALYESAKLYNWAFTSFTVRPALDIEQPVTELKVKYSVGQDSVMLLPDDDFKALLPIGDNSVQMQKKYDLPDYAEAPLAEGQNVGSVTLMVAGQELGSTGLTVAKGVERNNTLYRFSKAKDFLTSTYVKVFLSLLLIAALLYAALIYYSHERQKKHAQTKKQGQKKRTAKK